MGGGSNGAAQAADQEAKFERVRVADGTRRVNAMFDSGQRQADYGTFLDAMRTEGRANLDDQQQGAARDLKFSLARTGQFGGSVQADSAADLAKAYNAALIKNERNAQGALAGVRSADEDTRARLIAMIQGGGDAAASQQQAFSALRSNLEAGRAATDTNAFADTFTNFAQIAQRSREIGDYRRGLKQGVTLYGAPGGIS